MLNSNSGIGIDSGITEFFAGIGIKNQWAGIGIGMESVDFLLESESGPESDF